MGGSIANIFFQGIERITDWANGPIAYIAVPQAWPEAQAHWKL